MPRRGDQQTRPGGYRMVFRTTAHESDGALLETEATYLAISPPPAVHLHPSQDERFEVLEGAIWTRIGDVERVYGAGESFEVPCGTPHTMCSRAEVPTRFLWQVRPALRTAEMFETTWRIANEPGANGNPRPGLLRGAALMQEFAAEYRLVSPPRWIQLPLFALLAPIGRWMERRPASP